MNPDLFPARILCAWSKTTNVTYVTLADSRTMRANPLVKHKILGILNTKMDEMQAINDGKNLYPSILINLKFIRQAFRQ